MAIMVDQGMIMGRENGGRIFHFGAIGLGTILLAAGILILRVEAWTYLVTGTIVPESGVTTLSPRAASIAGETPPQVAGIASPRALEAASFLCETQWLKAMARDDQVASSALLDRCVETRAAEVAAAPRDGAAWLDYARLVAAQRDFDSTARAAFDMSWRTMPNEGWLMERRVLFAFDVWGNLPTETRKHLGEDFRPLIMSGHLLERIIDRARVDVQANAVAIEIAKSAGGDVPEWWARWVYEK